MTSVCEVFLCAAGLGIKATMSYDNYNTDDVSDQFQQGVNVNDEGGEGYGGEYSAPRSSGRYVGDTHAILASISGISSCHTGC